MMSCALAVIAPLIGILTSRMPFFPQLDWKPVCCSRPIPSRITPIVPRVPETLMERTPERAVPPSSSPLSSTKKRKLQSNEQHLLAGLKNILENASEDEYNFVCRVLKPETGDNKECLSLVAFMLQKGLLQKFLAMEKKNSQEAQEAPKVPEKVIRYKQLPKELLVMMIQAWESFDTKAKRELWRIPRDTLLKWVLFALNVKGYDELPKGEYRKTGSLFDYTRGRYQALFSRLKCLRGQEEIKEDSVPGYFSLDIPNNKIHLNIKLDRYPPTPTSGSISSTLSFNHDFGGHDDWIIVTPFSVHAKMVSVMAGETKTLRTKLQASCGVSLPEPNDVHPGSGEFRRASARASAPA